MRTRQIGPEEYAEMRERCAPDQMEYKYLLPEFNSELVEMAVTVVDSTGEKIASVVVIRVAEVVLIMEGKQHPTVKQEAIAKIHEYLRVNLRKKGYSQAMAVVPPFLKGYVRRMIRRFGWQEDYPCYRMN